MAAQNFDMVDIYSELAFRLGPNKTPLRVFGDVVWNVNDQATGAYKGKDFAAIGGVALGKINWKKGDWEIGYNYRYVQPELNARLPCATAVRRQGQGLRRG